MRNYKLVVFTILVCFGLLIIFPLNVAADGTPEVKINIMPNDVLFDITNMKPGDWAPRTLTIQNVGKLDFNYEMQVQNNGDSKLFNELILELVNDNGELFNGKLSEFSILTFGKLEADEEEELHLTIRFPEHLGNEFQGQESKFSFIFYAKGLEGKTDHSKVAGKIGSDQDGQKGGFALPKTATDMFKFLLIGFLLVSFGGLYFILKKVNKHYKTLQK